MILGVSTATYTFVHVLISFIGIGSGVAVMWGLLAGKRLDGISAIFLTSTALTSLTGFAFPVEHLMPSHVVGIISLVILALVFPARYIFRLSGAWRSVYVIGAAIAFYLNVFVLVVQSFEKVPALKALAPTQKEPPFLIAQLTVLVIFVGVTFLATKKFQLEPARV